MEIFKRIPFISVFVCIILIIILSSCYLMYSSQKDMEKKVEEAKYKALLSADYHEECSKKLFNLEAQIKTTEEKMQKQKTKLDEKVKSLDELQNLLIEQRKEKNALKLTWETLEKKFLHEVTEPIELPINGTSFSSSVEIENATLPLEDSF